MRFSREELLQRERGSHPDFFLWTIALELVRNLAGIEGPESTAPIQLQALQACLEFGSNSFVANVSCLYPTYIRGEVYLAIRQGTKAAAEFQKILVHSGIVWNCWTGALAHLGVARANVLEAKASQGADADAGRDRALAVYKDFLMLWKDADPEIPILKQAKGESAKLQ